MKRTVIAFASLGLIGCSDRPPDISALHTLLVMGWAKDGGGVVTGGELLRSDDGRNVLRSDGVEAKLEFVSTAADACADRHFEEDISVYALYRTPRTLEVYMVGVPHGEGGWQLCGEAVPGYASPSEQIFADAESMRAARDSFLAESHRRAPHPLAMRTLQIRDELGQAMRGAPPLMTRVGEFLADPAQHQHDEAVLVGHLLSAPGGDGYVLAGEDEADTAVAVDMHTSECLEQLEGELVGVAIRPADHFQADGPAITGFEVVQGGYAAVEPGERPIDIVCD